MYSHAIRTKTVRAIGLALCLSFAGAPTANDFAGQLFSRLPDGCFKGLPAVRSDPPDVPLQADLIAKQDRYVLNLSKLTPEEFSRKMTRSLPFEPAPDIERRNEKEKEIKRKLTMSVSFNFKKTPFRQVVDDFRVWTGINIVVDERALRNIWMDQPVEMKGDAVPLRSALRNILHQMWLTFVIEDEMLKITTQTYTKGQLVLENGRAEKACPVFALPSEDSAITPSRPETSRRAPAL
jgi:hypothetical protein